MARKIESIQVQKTDFKINLNKRKKNSLILDGKYKTNDSKFEKFKIINDLNFQNLDFVIELGLSENLFIDLINFKTDKSKPNVITSRFIFGKKGIDINYDDARNLIYGMPYSVWKKKYQKEASKDQLDEWNSNKN